MPSLLLLFPSSFVMTPIYMIPLLQYHVWRDLTSRIPLFITLIIRLNTQNTEFAPLIVMHNWMTRERQKSDKVRRC
jgi:hypothetical protein